MDIIEFTAIAIGFLAIIACVLWVSVHFSRKRDEKKFEQENTENQARLSRIKRYLDTVALSLDAENKDLVFKLKNRWKIIYDHFPISCGVTGFIPPLHPKLIRACVDRDNIEVELMDKGIHIKYPD